MVSLRKGSSASSRLMAAAVAVLVLGCAALAQDGPVPPIQGAPRDLTVPAEPPAGEPPAQRPGLFESIGRWFDEGGTTVRKHLGGAKDRVDALGEEAAQNGRELGGTAAGAGRTAVGTAVEATKDAVEVTKGAVGAVAKLPGTRVMKGHERCGMAPNGAPDCLAAADELCRKNGFSSGKSMDFTSAEECTARAYLSGRQAEAPDCHTVTFISRAVCQ